MNSVNNEDNNQINEKMNFLSQDMLFVAKMFNISCTFALLTFILFTCLLFCSYAILKEYMQIDRIDELCRFIFIVSILALLLNAYLIHKLCQINKRETKKFKKTTKELYELLFVYLENNKNNNKEERKNE